jgi:arsenate reductase
VKTALFPALLEYMETLEPGAISPARRAQLEPVVDYVSQRLPEEQAARLHFICTHNSRRSQLAQVWGHTLAHYHHLPLQCFSGGVEVTAFHPQAVAALRRAGFQIPAPPAGDNPPYLVHFALSTPPLTAYSKLYDAPENPTDAFAAIMTCAEAAENCPFIPGAQRRISLSYEDPKGAEGSPQQEAVYDDRCRQIATELLFITQELSAP